MAAARHRMMNIQEPTLKIPSPGSKYCEPGACRSLRRSRNRTGKATGLSSSVSPDIRTKALELKLLFLDAEPAIREICF